MPGKVKFEEIFGEKKYFWTAVLSDPHFKMGIRIRILPKIVMRIQIRILLSSIG
jgi:hypothetical protein